MDLISKTSVRRTCRIVSEATPVSLSRLFAVVTTMNLLPDRAEHSLGEDGTAMLDLEFVDVCPRQFDLLMRKSAQLTETLSVSEHRALKRKVM